jgi:hypothetical protein
MYTLNINTQELKRVNTSSLKIHPSSLLFRVSAIVNGMEN